MLKDELSPALDDERARLQQIAKKLVRQCWAELEQKSQGRFITHTVVLRATGKELRINWAKQWSQPGQKAAKYSKKSFPLDVRRKPYYSRRDIPQCPDWIWEVAERYEEQFTLIRKQNKMIGEIAQYLAGYDTLCGKEAEAYG
ncbi:conjugative transfer protein MobI(A/C) [Thalassospira sp. CH_XMU1420-2]|uniref:conjugative transfer protein MobI(A/C) n=1 Tax=Thalassospira sp. CH_XMU1420-2 TaxID=3107769 RepID=UPI0030087BF5|tara:strand:- start:3177 stop:3605 length:429 start_codon:yes stop_codon:yes gene_type:complete